MNKRYTQMLIGLVCITFWPVMAANTVAHDAVSRAVASSDRLARDTRRDATRKPEAVLRFFDIRPGQAVLDLFSGGGYYTELLARVIGKEGRVVAHNNQAYLPFAREALDERRYASRLPNVEPMLSEARDLQLAAASFDRIFYILGFHDIYYRDDNWPQIHDIQLLQHLYQSLRPGGLVAIIDHQALPGADKSSAQQYHRLASEHVIATMTQAGFVLQDSSDLLLNPDDPLNLSVFDKSIRGKTSRYMLKFVRLR